MSNEIKKRERCMNNTFDTFEISIKNQEILMDVLHIAVKELELTPSQFNTVQYFQHELMMAIAR